MLNARGCLPARNAPNLRLKTGNPGGLPGRANATIRSPAAASITSPRSGFGTAPSQTQSVDLPGVFVCAKRQCRDRVGGGEAETFAPFVYRLGRHPFTVERAVRFR